MPIPPTNGHQSAASAGRLGKIPPAGVARCAHEIHRPPSTGPPIETTPILDGKLITETAETAYKAKHQPRVPLMLGSNSADTAGNRVRARTKDELFARYGQWSAEAKAAYDPDGTAHFGHAGVAGQR
jgi:hypothetical protein